MKRPNKTKQEAFLKAFALTADVTKAAKAAKLDRSAHYEWLKIDPTYADRFKAAGEQFGDIVVAEMKRRAIDGWLEPVFYHGRICYMTRRRKKKNENGEVEIVYEETSTPLTVRKFDSALLQSLGRAFKPEMFRERVAAEVTGKDGAPIETALTVTFVRPKE